MKIIFMGTPDFACPCLQKLIESDNEVVAVYSQPDKPVGRKQIMTAPPVKELALNNNIPVYQPASLKNEEEAEKIRQLGADIIVVVAYGKILPKSILESCRYGCVNVHASLLPKYRGAAPIQWSVINGDKKTGVTIMQMDEGLDTGDILSVVETEIDINETSEMLFDRLSVIGADALVSTLKDISAGNIKPVKQPADGASHVSKITKAMSDIDWNKTAFEVHNLVRGLQSWPCAQTVINGKITKIHKTVLSDKTGTNAGEVVASKDVITVCCGDGKCVDILELQPEGKKRMDAKSYLLGNSLESGTIIGG